MTLAVNNETTEFSVKDIQNKMLDILLYFDSFCKENNLRYFLCGGTCLGAVRHKGFIPWDDDVDVFMLREDYEKLQSLWEENADKDKYACVRSNDKVNIHHSATEIKDNNTTFINKHSVDCDIHHGLMIDVIPIDGIPESSFLRILQMIDSMIYCCFNFQRLPEHKGKLIYYATKLALSVFKGDKIRYKIWKGAEKRISKYGTKNCKQVASFGEGATIMKMRFPTQWFYTEKYLEFEGHNLPVPADFDEYLKISFGDYMQLPPEEDRIARHNAVFIDLENSYTKYKGIHYCKK
ncbi:MAG: LicD family protein [Clostridia bacterium]|nr:LicD family protein [Clostridia bacterium]